VLARRPYRIKRHDELSASFCREFRALNVREVAQMITLAIDHFHVYSTKQNWERLTVRPRLDAVDRCPLHQRWAERTIADP
jgi:hypothetical protein